MPEIQIPSIVITGLQVILAFVGAFLVALWLSMIVWTFRDARARSRDIFAILLATLMVVVLARWGYCSIFCCDHPLPWPNFTNGRLKRKPCCKIWKSGRAAPAVLARLKMSGFCAPIATLP